MPAMCNVGGKLTSLSDRVLNVFTELCNALPYSNNKEWLISRAMEVCRDVRESLAWGKERIAQLEAVVEEHEKYFFKTKEANKYPDPQDQSRIVRIEDSIRNLESFVHAFTKEIKNEVEKIPNRVFSDEQLQESFDIQGDRITKACHRISKLEGKSSVFGGRL